LRSGFANLETETFVEFVFELGDRRYFVRRAPEQELKARRVESRIRPQMAAVFDATGIDPDAISEANPGRPLAERKVRDVDQVISGLLGYNAEQFRQVVMLPQRKFRDLLTADSDKRSSILRGLFDVGVFERFAGELKDLAGELEVDVVACRHEIESRLAEQEVDTAEALDEIIAILKTDLLQAEADRLDAERVRTTAETALSEARALAGDSPNTPPRCRSFKLSLRATPKSRH
jgi:exonuclease SbcC